MLCGTDVIVHSPDIIYHELLSVLFLLSSFFFISLGGVPEIGKPTAKHGLCRLLMRSRKRGGVDPYYGNTVTHLIF
jgi:hypothetical protein